jgi:protein phosphatase
MKIEVGNAQHIGDRQQQQDSFGFSDPTNETFAAHGGFLGVVADGMGGLANGSEASHAAVRTFLRTYESKAPTEAIPDALARSMIAANHEVVALAEQVDSRDGTGTTLAAAVLHGDSLHWISAGDSRVYLCHGNGLIRVTSDHVYARRLNQEVAAGKISRAEAAENAERAALTSFLGDLKDVDRSLRPFLLSKGDRVFLCSDGLYRALSEAEITTALKNDPQTACDTLVEQTLAKHRKHQDNLTVLALAPAEAKTEAPGFSSRRNLIIAGLLVLAAIAAGTYYVWKSRQPGRPASTPQSAVSTAAPGAAGTSPGTPVSGQAATQTSPTEVSAAGSAAQQADSGKGTSATKDKAGNQGKTKTSSGEGVAASGGHGSKPKPASDNKSQAEGKSSPPPAGSSGASPGPAGSAQSQGEQATPGRASAPGSSSGSATPASTPATSEPKPPASGQPQDGQGTTTVPPASGAASGSPSTSPAPPATDAGAAQNPPAENSPSPPPSTPPPFD